VIDIAHNPDRVPDAGSCIFFHVWGSGPAPTTTGCTAMAQDKLEALMIAIDPAAAPLYVLLPREVYDAQQAAWGLPLL
jgi:L,D-peptidoglycan transpeptidase YkuD (ErfK/YbiS/YcfS/YnhG family)